MILQRNNCRFCFVFADEIDDDGDSPNITHMNPQPSAPLPPLELMPHNGVWPYPPPNVAAREAAARAAGGGGGGAGMGGGGAGMGGG